MDTDYVNLVFLHFENVYDAVVRDDDVDDDAYLSTSSKQRLENDYFFFFGFLLKPWPYDTEIINLFLYTIFFN